MSPDVYLHKSDGHTYGRATDPSVLILSFVIFFFFSFSFLYIFFFRN